jgi:hypothetical protein
MVPPRRMIQLFFVIATINPNDRCLDYIPLAAASTKRLV